MWCQLPGGRRPRGATAREQPGRRGRSAPRKGSHLQALGEPLGDFDPLGRCREVGAEHRTHLQASGEPLGDCDPLGRCRGVGVLPLRPAGGGRRGGHRPGKVRADRKFRPPKGLALQASGKPLAKKFARAVPEDWCEQPAPKEGQASFLQVRLPEVPVQRLPRNLELPGFGLAPGQTAAPPRGAVTFTRQVGHPSMGCAFWPFWSERS